MRKTTLLTIAGITFALLFAFGVPTAQAGVGISIGIPLPGVAFYAPAPPVYYSPGYYSPGYVYTTTIVRMETEAYSLTDDRLVWAALSKTTDPGNARKLIDDVTRTVATHLTDQGLVAWAADPSPRGARARGARRATCCAA